MTVLVTGANGFVGANLVRCLIRNGYRVRGLVRDTSDLRSLEGLEVDLVPGDLFDVRSLIRAARGCDLIFHTAAFYSYARHSTKELMRTAEAGTRHLMEAARERSVGRVVLTSSSVVFGSTTEPVPLDERHRVAEPDPPPYTLSKIRQEQTAFGLADRFGIELVAACPTVCLGPHDYGLTESNAIIVNYLHDPLRSTWPGGCNIVSVADVAEGHRLIAERGRPGRRYLMGAENLTWSEIHTLISALCGVPGPLVTAGHTACFLAGVYHEAVGLLNGKRPLVSRVQARMVGRYYYYDTRRIAELGYRPVPARRALASAVSWLARSEHIPARMRNGMTLSKEVHDQRLLEGGMDEIQYRQHGQTSDSGGLAGDAG
jgi:dihydroflavonol-4-reductase